MKHLGDITKLSGYVVPAVDVVIGGSPCQGLSVAGKQAGLKDERSGLFIEQIRLVKEMRKADAARGKTNDAIRPRYMVWENVPGAFSSNKGRDFEAVLEETVRVAEPKAPPVPVPAKGWPTSGCLMGDGWSVAWRVLDAQFWGTPDKPLPQRRRRISLVADFGGRTAPEILFERESVSWNPDESRATAERNSCSPESNFGNAGRAGMERARRNGEPEPQVIASGVDCRSYNVSEGVSGTILAKRISSHFALEYQNPALDASLITTKNANVAGTLDASYYKGCGMRSGVEREVVVDAIPINDKATRFQGGGATRNQDGAGNGLGVGKPGDPSPTLTAADRHIVFAKTAIAFTERGRKGAEIAWLVMAATCHETFGYGRDRLARLKQNSMNNYKQYLEWEKEDKDLALDRLRRCVQDALKEDLRVTDTDERKGMLSTPGRGPSVYETAAVYSEIFRRARAGRAVAPLAVYSAAKYDETMTAARKRASVMLGL